jgi:threonine synthase
MPTHYIAECLDCGHKSSYSPLEPGCPACGSYWREARYDYPRIGAELPSKLLRRSFDLWRYRELLPVRAPVPEIVLGEGGTPLIRAYNLGMMLGCPNIFIKDERQGPTISFKDRQAAVTITSLKEAGLTELVVASTGNVAISYSAYAARAGIKLWAILTSLVPSSKMREVAIYGTQVIKVTGSYDSAKQLAAEFAKQRNVFFDLGARSIPAIESMKTIAYEVCEQIPALLDPNTPDDIISWRSPDWYIQAVSGGMGPLGVIKGFDEMKQMGWIHRIPKIALVQSQGCAPMMHAWRDNLDVAVPVTNPLTHIETLATGDPGRTYTLLRKKMLAASGGCVESATDEEAFRATHLLAKMEGLSVEPAAAVAFAGLIKMVRSGQIKPNDVIVVNCTGHTMPIERELLGDDYTHDVIMPRKEMEQSQEEGLLAALSQVSMERFPRVAIVDDKPEVRQLVRRILQSQGEYELFEACNGREAVELAIREHPNLMILDLMMPEMDGFSVLDALQANRDTANIPVIVVTAKELTSAEKLRLKGRIQSLMQKGDFMSDELLEEVRALLRDS